MTNLTWRKSSYSGYNGNCPEIAITTGNAHTYTGEAADAYAQGRIDGAAAERQRLVHDHVTEQDAVHADLALLLRVLGLGDHARPESPHKVMLDAINEVGKLRTALESVYRWLVDDLAYPFDMHADPDSKPAWLDVERLAAVWDAKDGETPGTYLDAIYEETGWPRP